MTSSPVDRGTEQRATSAIEERVAEALVSEFGETSPEPVWDIVARAHAIAECLTERGLLRSNTVGLAAGYIRLHESEQSWYERVDTAETKLQKVRSLCAEATSWAKESEHHGYVFVPDLLAVLAYAEPLDAENG